MLALCFFLYRSRCWVVVEVARSGQETAPVPCGGDLPWGAAECQTDQDFHF